MNAGPVPIVALDVPTLADARTLVARLGPAADFFKVGLQLYTRAGPPVVEWLRREGKRVFLDLKLHDIPNTVQGAAASAAALGVDLLTVHALGGARLVRAAVEGAGGAGSRTGILAVTVLTSYSEAEYGEAVGQPGVRTAEVVLRQAAMAAGQGVRGVVCAGSEAAQVLAAHGDALGVLVPGLRRSGGAAHDQSRVATPAEVRAAGATWVVVGRVVTAEPDPAAAYAGLVADLRGEVRR
ncbi:MAG: orotidine-5'-phosphate decarboxylase [Gemmatimonadota bacterium]|nr:orotidine-5'-phosphate decarboxylase [Gemmatimonadota bacterium]